MRDMRVILSCMLVLALLAGIAPYAEDTQSPGSTSSFERHTPVPDGSQPLETESLDSVLAEEAFLQGILNPAVVEQRGLVLSDNTSARTDTTPSPTVSLPLDIESSWVFSEGSIEIYGLDRLYAVNGSFDEGYPGSNIDPNGTVAYYPYGWTADSNSSSADTQMASYVQSSENYILVENQGEKKPGTANIYRHYAGSAVFWEQEIYNSPYTEDFELSLSFLYDSGPLGQNIAEGCSLYVSIDDVPVWTINLVNLTQRDVWFDSGIIAIHYPGAPLSFNVSVGLIIDNFLELDENDDNDLDGNPDGLANAKYITVHIDDFALTGTEPPSFESVDLSLEAGGEVCVITGTDGRGNATVYFDPPHDTDPLVVSVHSNTSVRFNFIASALAHRFINSTFSTDIDDEGVMYETSANKGVDLLLFTYLGFVGDYSNFAVRIYYPEDWDNVTVYDPFLKDVTSECAISPGMVVLSGSILSRLGWWELNLQSPNYAQSIQTQKYDSDVASWLDSEIFRTDNNTRAQVTIATSLESPYLNDPINFTWYLPNGSLWVGYSLTPNSVGTVNSSSHTIGVGNSSAGEWRVIMAWSNGTEVAIGAARFVVVHSSSLEVAVAEIEVTSGEIISNFVKFRDTETGEYLTEDHISVTANWTIGEITFTQNLVRKRYEADFDTSDLQEGITSVNVTAVSLYHDPSSIHFVIVVPYGTTATLFDVDDGVVEVDVFVATPVNMRYEKTDGSGIQDASISVHYSGSAGGMEWVEVANGDSGNYTIEFTGKESGIYEVDIVFSKYAHEDAHTSFLFIVGGLGSVLTLLNGTSKSIEYGSDFNLFLRFENTTGYGLENASISVQSTGEDDAIFIGAVSELGGGDYSVYLSPYEADTFTIIVGASTPIHDTQYATFTLTVIDIDMSLTYRLSASSIPIGRNITVTLELYDANSDPVTGALLEFIDPPSSAILDLSTSMYSDNGRYTFNVSFIETGSFVLSVRASKENHRNSTSAISIVVTNIPTSLSTSEGLSSAAIEYGSSLELVLFFVRTDLMVNVSEAVIEVQADDLSGLTISIVENQSAYRVRIRSNRTGRWVFTFTGTKMDHDPDLMQFTLDVQLIGTDLSGIGPLSSIYLLRSYELPFSYEMTNGTGILGASISKSGPGSEYVSVRDDGEGHYSVLLTPEDVGTYSVRLTFGKLGHRSREYTLSFSVTPVPLEVTVESLSWSQGLPLVIVARVVEADTDVPVDDATVRFQLYTDNAVIAEGTLNSVGNGVYRSQVDEDWINDNTLELSLSVTKEGYDLEVPVVLSVISVPNPDIQNYQNFMTYGVPSIGVFVFVTVGLLVYRWREKRLQELRRQNAHIKQRFSDAQNILGVLVMHKKSGLPIYSQAMKPGLDEGVLSAFISAISHFRSEFGLEEVNSYSAIPISDVVRVVPTENLLCATVTLTPPSDEQEERMIEGAKAVHERFDNQFEETPVEFRDEFTAAIFDQMFEEYLDGYLLREYQINSDMDVPRNLRCVKEGVEALESRYFKLSGLARAMSSCGFSDTMIYRKIWDALEFGLLIRTPSSKPDRGLDWDTPIES